MMPVCYGNSGGYGRFLERVQQPLAEQTSGSARKKGTGSRQSCRNRAVRQVETGVEFRNAYAAALAMLAGTTQDPMNAAKEIRKCCRGNRISWRGCRWEYIGEGSGADAVQEDD